MSVYLIAQPSVARGPHDRQMVIEPAKAFGEIKTLIPAGEYPKFNPERAMRLISEGLQDFKQDDDFVVWAGGDTLAAIMTGIVLYRGGHDFMWWLRYERGSDPVTGRRTDEGSTYTPVKVPLLMPDWQDEHQLDLLSTATEHGNQPA